MRTNVERMRLAVVWLGVACLGLMPVGPILAQEPKFTLTGHTQDLTPVAFSPDGKTLALGSGDHTIILWNVATSRNTATLKAHTSTVYSVAFSPDGETLASKSGDKTIKLWDMPVAK